MDNLETQLNHSEYFTKENHLQDMGGVHLDTPTLASKMETGPFQDERALLAFESLVDKLKDKLSTYDTILSDDASGRLVSLVLRGVIDKSRKKLGLSPVQTYFLASGRHDSKEIMQKIENFLRVKGQKSKKALLVTEYISTGQSISKLIHILDKAEISFDLAALSICDSPEDYDSEISSRLSYGEQSQTGLSFYNMRNLSGVEKDETAGLPHPTRRIKGDLDLVVEARRDIKKLVEALTPNL